MHDNLSVTTLKTTVFGMKTGREKIFSMRQTRWRAGDRVGRTLKTLVAKNVHW